ncbi:MAG: PHP domain-containing protein [Actinomycetota bacterium]|nr:PHP domain-containing protein [Actinomycetota bacterium]
MLIDLHTHSTRSDGTATPADLVGQAAQRGLDVLGLTDHDTADGWPEAVEAASVQGITLVRGMEISTRYDGRSVHLLAYLPDPTYPPLAEELARIRAGRDGRLPMMVDRLRGLGIDISEQDIRAAGEDGAVIGRPHVADALVRKGVVAHRDEAFRTMLGPGGAANVSRYATALLDAMDLVRASGGVSVLAHPWGRGRVLTPQGLATLAERGLTGIEVDHQNHTLEQRELLRGIAGELGLVATGSSDFHGTGKVDHELGCNTTNPAQFARLVAAATLSREASGRPAPQVLEAGAVSGRE